MRNWARGLGTDFDGADWPRHPIRSAAAAQDSDSARLQSFHSRWASALTQRAGFLYGAKPEDPLVLTASVGLWWRPRRLRD